MFTNDLYSISFKNILSYCMQDPVPSFSFRTYAKGIAIILKTISTFMSVCPSTSIFHPILSVQKLGLIPVVVLRSKWQLGHPKGLEFKVH